MSRKTYTNSCTVSGDRRTITIQVMNLPFATDPSSNTLNLGFECDKYLYGYCPNAKICPLFKKVIRERM